ncbi:N/A [soil metagenome]
MPPLGLIEVAFDPLIHLGELSIRWQTIGISVALLVALGVAAAIASHLPRPTRRAAVAEDRGPFPDAPSPAVATGADRLRLDDLAYIVLGSVAGAVLGGRLVHGLVFWDAYAQDPGRLLDPGSGSLSLLGAVLGGTVTAAYVGLLLRAPVRRWADAGAVPLLLVLGLGKLAQFLGGSGQGAPFDGEWAVAFLGPGPWASLNPEVAAHPAQVYESLLMLIGIPIVLGVGGPGRDLARILHPALRRLASRVRGHGRLFAVTFTWFLLGRVLVGFTWRDEPLVGPLNAEQAVALAILVGVVIAVAVRGARRKPAAAPASG